MDTLARMRQSVLSRLADQTSPFDICDLAEAIGLEHGSGNGELARIRGLEAAQSMLSGETDQFLVRRLSEVATALAVTERERERVRAALLDKLVGTADYLTVQTIAVAIDDLGVTELELTQARAALVTTLAGDANCENSPITAVLADLEPTVTDLTGSRNWKKPPTSDLLASARENSALPTWITALPQLSITSDNT
jgi:hypothetical protein